MTEFAAKKLSPELSRVSSSRAVLFALLKEEVTQVSFGFKSTVCPMLYYFAFHDIELIDSVVQLGSGLYNVADPGKTRLIQVVETLQLFLVVAGLRRNATQLPPVAMAAHQLPTSQGLVRAC